MKAKKIIIIYKKNKKMKKIKFSKGKRKAESGIVPPR